VFAFKIITKPQTNQQAALKVAEFLVGAKIFMRLASCAITSTQLCVYHSTMLGL
jgi:hypothetical protein